ETGPQGSIIADGPIAVELHEFIKNEVDVIDGLRPVRMAGDLNGLPGRQVDVFLFDKADELAAHTPDFGATAATGLELGQEIFHLIDLFFKRQPLGGHGTVPFSNPSSLNGANITRSFVQLRF